MPWFSACTHTSAFDWRDAVIYSVSDAALMKNIGQYYAQGRSKDGKVTELVH